MQKLSSLILSLIVLSCGKTAVDRKPVSPRNVIATNQSSNPIPLKSDRTKSLCSVTLLEDSQRNLNLSLFIQGKETDEERVFSGLIDGLTVRDIGAKIVTDTTKDLSVIHYYTSTDDVISTDQSILTPKSSVSICPDDGKYERGSVESAALNATYFISKTNRKVSRLLPSVAIPAVEIQIAPLIKKSFKVIVKGETVWTFEAFETDNAYYQPGTNTITFLPHSDEFRKAGVTMSFWEIPMVASHEYGHHLFETLHPYNPQTTAMKNCFGKMGLHSEVKELGTRKVTNDDVLGALNEGFADLVSFYTLDDHERGLTGVPCLEISRDVSSNSFADGTPKTFSAKALGNFFASKQIESSPACTAPNYQDIHTIGAVFANGADRLLSLTTESKDKKLSVVLAWLQEMKARSQDLKTLSPESFLAEAFKLLIETAALKTDGKVDPSECELSREIYPGIEGSFAACS